MVFTNKTKTLTTTTTHKNLLTAENFQTNDGQLHRHGDDDMYISDTHSRRDAAFRIVLELKAQ